ncbi:hypothetical protein ACVWYH_002350 [Bradyrhizobium sp. GM24.11]
MNHEAETYALLRRVCPDCHTFRPVKDYTTRRIRTVFDTVRFAIRGGCCAGNAIQGRSSDTGADGTDGAARKHAALPAGAEGAGPISWPLNRLRRMRSCASVPSGSASGSTTRSCRKRGAQRPKRMTDASLRCGFPEIGAKGSSPALKRRTFVALINIRREISSSSWPDAAAGDGEKGAVAISSPAAPISKQSRSCSSLSPCRISRLWGCDGDLGPGRNPKPAALRHALTNDPHDRLVHIAMKIQPMQQIADHIVRSRSRTFEALPTIDRDIRAVRWRLWHGRVGRAIRDLEQLLGSKLN